MRGLLAADACARADGEPDHDLAKWWYGVAHGYECAADELRNMRGSEVAESGDGGRT